MGGVNNTVVVFHDIIFVPFIFLPSTVKELQLAAILLKFVLDSQVIYHTNNTVGARKDSVSDITTTSHLSRNET